jgi:hypothetical protein
MTTYYEESQDSDPWSNFDPEVAGALRAVLQHEIDQQTAPFRQAEADRNLKADEDRMRAVYPEYERNRLAILTHGLDRGITNIEDAFHAWRGSSDPATSPVNAQSDAGAEDKEHERRLARLEEIRYDDSPAAVRERADLKHAESEWQDARATSMFKAAADSESDRNDVLEELREARKAREKDQPFRRSIDERPRVSTEEKRAEMDLRAIELFRGKAPEKESVSRRSDRDEFYGLNNLESAFANQIAADNASNESTS